MNPRFAEQKENLREVMRSIHLIMVESFGVRKIKVVPVGDEGSRLSIPIKITGISANGEPVSYFAKIIGSSDIMTEKTIQFMKNLYLHMETRTPLFGFTHSAEDMARYQFNTLTAICELGIPTAKPLGIFSLPGGLWLLVTEFLVFPKLVSVKMVSDHQLDGAFKNIYIMHSKGIFHGDIKPDNFMFNDKLYILDVGNFLEEAPNKEKRAYDLACLIASFLERSTTEKVVEIAIKYYPKRDLKRAITYFDLIMLRPDFRFDEVKKERLVALLV
jgi:serine/threonine protein kinase